MTSSAAPASHAGWLARLGRRLEEDHALLAGVFLVVLSVFLAHATLSTAAKGRQDVDVTSQQIAAQMLGQQSSPPSPVQFGSPGYPLVLYAMARADSDVAAAIACRTGPRCEREGSFRSLIGVQLALAIASLVLIFVLALRLSGLWEVGLLALLLAFLESRMGEFAASVSPLPWSAATTLLYSLLALEAYRRASPTFAFGAGVVVGISALFLTWTLAAIPALIILLAVGARARPGRGRAGLALACVAGVLVAAGLGVVAWSLSYDPQAVGRLLTLQLAERIGFEAMTPLAWVGGLILPIPFLGGWLEFLFPDSIANSLAHGYAALGRETIFPKAEAQPGPALAQYGWLLKSQVLDAPGSYLAVIPPILNRGMWGGGGIVALIGIFSLKRLVSLHVAHGRGGELSVVFVPVVCMLAASTLLSANQFTHVPLLSFVFAYAVAYVTARFPEATRDAEA